MTLSDLTQLLDHQIQREARAKSSRGGCIERMQGSIAGGLIRDNGGVATTPRETNNNSDLISFATGGPV